MTAEELVDRCLDILGPVELSEGTRSELVEHSEQDGPVSWSDDREGSERRVGDTLALIAATREYQFG